MSMINKEAAGRTAARRTPAKSRPDASPFIELRRLLAYRLSKLANHVTRTLAAVYSETQQLTTSEWKVLSILAETAGLGGTEVSLRSTLDRFAVSKTISRLIGRGLIMSQRAQTDGRANVLALTTHGWEIYRPIAQQAFRQQEQLLAALTPEEQETLFALFDKLDAHIAQGGAGPDAVRDTSARGEA
jgi:DNA-binding MarR family transcriptional regulator